EETRGRASTIDELFTILTHKEIQKVFELDAFKGLQKVFKDKKIKASEESYFGNINGLQVNFISNGYEITTLVFYF
ncbi:MAG: hypothetical protein NC087_10295, partial [Anaeroplasma bactoclasticum]|nr:hypothetical protein [Anaeroplasma bactoclasticum]